MDAILETSRRHWPCSSNTGTRGTGLGTLQYVTQYHRQQQIAVNVERLVRAEKYTSSRGVLRTGSVIQFPFSAAQSTGYKSVWVHHAPNCKEQCNPSTTVQTIHYIIRGLPEHSRFNARFFIAIFGIPKYFL
jgi:hypothetical protein